jgi:hypothetical protein
VVLRLHKKRPTFAPGFDKFYMKTISTITIVKTACRVIMCVYIYMYMCMCMAMPRTDAGVFYDSCF